MVKERKPLFISFSNLIKPDGTEDKDGNIEIFTQIQYFPVSDEQLLEIKKIQEEAAEKIDALFRS